MPYYVYEVVLPDGDEGQQFEVFQRMTDPPLTEHPTTGQPVRRVIQAPYLPSKWTDRQMSRSLTDGNLERQGFTKYQKVGDGQYEKTVGKGPDTISNNDV